MQPFAFTYQCSATTCLSECTGTLADTLVEFDTTMIVERQREARRNTDKDAGIIIGDERVNRNDKCAGLADPLNKFIRCLLSLDEGLLLFGVELFRLAGLGFLLRAYLTSMLARTPADPITGDEPVTVSLWRRSQAILVINCLGVHDLEDAELGVRSPLVPEAVILKRSLRKQRHRITDAVTVIGIGDHTIDRAERTDGATDAGAVAPISAA